MFVVLSMLGGCLPTNGGGGGSGSSCEADEVRARPSDLPRACYLTCETQADCSGDTTCAEVNGGNDLACLPEAVASNNPTNNTNPDCASDAECSGATPMCSEGVCVPDEVSNNPLNNPVGCVADGECSGATPVCDEGVCVAEADPCDAIDCEAGFTCEAGQCIEDVVPGCTEDSQCMTDEVCRDGECVAAPDPCAGVQCDAGFTCEAGQCVEDVVPGCTNDGQCQAREICRDGACIPDVQSECIFNSDCDAIEICQDGECVRDPNIECVADRDCTGNGEVCQNNACVVPFDPAQQQCMSYCQNIFGSCPKSTCNGLDASTTTFLDDAFDRCLNGGTTPGGVAVTPCVQEYASDPQFAAQVDQFAAETCGSSALEGIYCDSLGLGAQCDCPVPSVGEPCLGDTDCDGGTLNPICIPEFDQSTGDPTGYTGGYCVAGPCDAGNQDVGSIAVGATTGCGEEAMCINENTQSGVASICYELCSTNSECRSGYSCEILGFFSDGTAAGRCQPACSTNADCPEYTENVTGNLIASFCNADQWCESPCNPNEVGSCGTSGNLRCTARPNFNPSLDFTGSCEVAP